MDNKQNPAPLQRIEFGHQSVEERIKHFNDFTIALNDEQIHMQAMRCLHCGTPTARQAARCTTVRSTSTGSCATASGARPGVPQLHEQLSGVHKPRLPGNLRGGLHAVLPRRCRRRHQDDRARDHRPRLALGLGSSHARAPQDGKARGGDRLGPLGVGLCAAVGARRPQGHRL